MKYRAGERRKAVEYEKAISDWWKKNKTFEQSINNRRDRKDFVFYEVDNTNGHTDYWFIVLGETRKQLTEKYNEMCMVGVKEIVYSQDEDIVGIKRQFHWSYDVVISDDETLKEILKSIIKEMN